MEQMENYIMNKLDLDEYNITSDDFLSSGPGSKRLIAEKQRSKSSDAKLKNACKKLHPLVPKLDLQKIFDWREKANNDNVIMIRISESRILGEDMITEEINDEDGVQKKYKKYYVKGSPLVTSSSRINELFDRKQAIISALNQVYDDEEDDQLMTP